MIIEMSNALMIILVIATLVFFITEPELILFVILLGIAAIIAYSYSGKELAIKSENFIIQVNPRLDENSTVFTQ